MALLLTMGLAQRAEGASAFEQGNRAYAAGDFYTASEEYRHALEQAPGSAGIHYNLGNALYREGAFGEAMENYVQAAQLAPTESLRGRCWYNAGNCAVRGAEAVRKKDPSAAVLALRQATRLYRTALESDPGLQDAAYNLEVAQRISASLQRQIQQQEQRKKKQDDFVEYVRKKLKEFIVRQTRLASRKQTGKAQAELESETRELAKKMEESGLCAGFRMPDGSEVSAPLKESLGHTQGAADAMAAPDPPLAGRELRAALAALPKGQDNPGDNQNEDSEEESDSSMDYDQSDSSGSEYEEGDPFGDFSDYEEIRGVPPPSQSETDILNEEIRNRQRRKAKSGGEYKKVDKDW